jgi:hypothetical protein
MSKDKVVDKTLKEVPENQFTPPMSFEAQVWDKLSHIEVEDHMSMLPKTGKRPPIPYLPWHKAWLLVAREFPATQFEYENNEVFTDGTVEVMVRVRIQSEAGGSTRHTMCKLAVMDNYFGAIENPTARQVNDSRQRCLVKALAFAGLGLNLWSESIEPVGKLDDPISVEEFDEVMKLIKSTDSDMTAFLKWCKVEGLVDLPYERYGSAISLLEAKARRQKVKKLKEEDVA